MSAELAELTRSMDVLEAERKRHRAREERSLVGPCRRRQMGRRALELRDLLDELGIEAPNYYHRYQLPTGAEPAAQHALLTPEWLAEEGLAGRAGAAGLERRVAAVFGPSPQELERLVGLLPDLVPDGGLYLLVLSVSRQTGRGLEGSVGCCLVGWWLPAVCPGDYVAG